MTELRNPALAAELERAIAEGARAPFLALLCRFSGLPGPRANEKLAWAVAHAITAHGPRADSLVRELCAGGGRASDKGTVEFLPIVGAFCLATRFAAGAQCDATLEALRPVAEDPRRLVRQGVVHALVEMGRMRGDEVLEGLQSWTDGYLSAIVILEAISTRVWLDAMKSSDACISRLDEVFALAENAPRADQRSQGYRSLIKAFPEAASKLMDRFAPATVAWLEERAGTEHVELREAFAELAQRVRASGHAAGTLERFDRLFEASAPPRRDPKTYVGPTRKRGARRR
jgi:hypothetical protein